MASKRPRSNVEQPNRTVMVSPFLETVGTADPGVLTLLPNRQAARSMGLPYRHLEQQAVRLLQEDGRHVARRITAVRTLERAVRRAAPNHDPAGLARAVEPALRSLLRAGVNFESIAHSVETRIARIGRIGVEYLRALREQDLVDDAEVLWRAADLKPHREVICLSGYPRLPAAERNFLNALAAAGSVVHLPVANGDLFAENRSACEDFRAAGWAIVESGDKPEDPVPALEHRVAGPGARLAARWLHAQTPAEDAGVDLIEAYAYSDLESEARGALASVKGLLLGGTDPERIALVARNEEAYGPVLISVAREFGVPLRALYTIPLAHTRLGHWITSLLEAFRNDLPFEETARVLAHPLAAALDSESWSEARTVGATGWESWSHYQPALTCFWPTTAEGRGEQVSLREHCNRLLESLRVLGVRDKALRWPREAKAFQVLTDELRLLGRSDKRLDFDGFVAEIEEIVTVLVVPAAPGRGGVELHTPLSLFGAKVDYLFILGAYDGNMPKPIHGDPMLDPFELEQLRAEGHRVEGVEAEARREDLSFWALLHAARKRVRLSYPKLLGRSEVMPSPYLERLALVPVEAPTRPVCSWPEARRAVLASEDRFRLGSVSAPEVGHEVGPEVGLDAEPGDPVIDRSRAAFEVELRRESEEPWDGHDGEVGIPYRPSSKGTGVSRIIELARCPFKFFAGSMLGLAETEEVPGELDPSLRGRLYHDTLELALASAANLPAKADEAEVPGAVGGGRNGESAEEVGKSGNGSVADSSDAREGATDRLRAAALAALDASFEAAEETLALVSLRSWPLEREGHLSTLRRAIESAEFIAEDARVRHLEGSFSANWRGIPVRGRVDRIDETDEGLTLIDYKTGSRVYNLAKNAAGRPAIDLQLRIYREAAAAVLAPGKQVAGTRYFSINDAKNISVKEPPEDELERIAAEIESSWRNGSFPVDPDLDGSACTYCDFDSLCRRGPRLERKRNRQ